MTRLPAPRGACRQLAVVWHSEPAIDVSRLSHQTAASFSSPWAFRSFEHAPVPPARLRLLQGVRQHRSEAKSDSEVSLDSIPVPARSGGHGCHSFDKTAVVVAAEHDEALDGPEEPLPGAPHVRIARASQFATMVLAHPARESRQRFSLRRPSTNDEVTSLPTGDPGPKLDLNAGIPTCRPQKRN
jgi:hypothetical protein